MTTAGCRLDTPLGILTLHSDGEALIRIRLPKEESRETLVIDEAVPVLVAARAQLREYFAGQRREFNLALAPQGTPFQRRVWRELARIPAGQTITYGQLAARIGNPRASRAVGAANGRNPLPIIVPCHRVIGANGKLTGFAGGLAAKAWLLQHEKRR